MMYLLDLVRQLLLYTDHVNREIVVRIVRRDKEYGKITHEAIVPHFWITADVAPTKYGQTGITIEEHDIKWIEI